MDENRPRYSLLAPGGGSSSSALRLPGGERSFPPVDDHLVQSEVSRDEIVGGRKMEAFPARGPHAMQHFRLDYVISAHIAPGYTGGSDLLTRHGTESDFASDTAVFKEGIDPKTGTRYLEEVAFEVVGDQTRRVVSQKASIMLDRGVRRVFAIFVKSGTVEEWSKEKRRFVPVPPGALLRDECWVRPIQVAALLDAARADGEVAKALIVKKNNVLMDFRAEGEAKGKAESIVRILEMRSLEISDSLRQQILSCQDLATLNRWFERVLVVTGSDQILID